MGDHLTRIQPIKKYLIDRGWRTPDTYGKEFAAAGDFPAVYLFLLHETEYYNHGMVAYVGMSKMLAQRWCGHDILRQLPSSFDWYRQRWFILTAEDALRDVEKHYIQKYNPPWNIVGKARGVHLQ